MLIGLSGTDGAGKGEKAWDAFARPFEKFLERANRNVQKVYCVCKASVPQPM